MSSPAAWHADPYNRFQLRYWDGARWTEHVSNNGVQAIDDPTSLPTPVAGWGGGENSAVPTTNDTADKIQHQVQAKAGVGPISGGQGTLFTEPILVVNQKKKLIEIVNEYAVFDQHGVQIGAIREIGQTMVKKAVRLLSSFDQFLTHRLEIVDMTGAVQLSVTRPAKLMKSTVIVNNPAGVEIGRIVQDNVFGKIRFSLQSGGLTYGSINAENWRAWNFNIQDHTGQEVARITKTWEGVLTTIFTTADNYVLQIHQPLVEPLRSLVVASALTVDTALKQDSRGLG